MQTIEWSPTAYRAWKASPEVTVTRSNTLEPAGSGSAASIVVAGGSVVPELLDVARSTPHLQHHCPKPAARGRI